MTDSLVTYSVVAAWSAIAVYALAFIAFTFDLAGRGAAAPAAAVGSTAGTVGMSMGGSPSGATTGVLEKAVAQAARVGGSSRWQRMAMALTLVAWIMHASAAVFRGLAAGRVPWANMFEFSLTFTAIIVGVFLLAQLWQDLRFLGAFVSGFVVLFMGLAATNFYVDVVPLPPALQSAWLVIHVFVASLGTGFFALGAGLSAVQLLQSRRETAGSTRLRFLTTLPNAEVLEGWAYRVIVVGFAFWTFTLMAGAIWASHAWGRYWGWDTKEVWTFIIWVIFAGYIHARATLGWRGARSAWLALVGFGSVLFNFTIVNLFFKGLHTYSGL